MSNAYVVSWLDRVRETVRREGFRCLLDAREFAARLERRAGRHAFVSITTKEARRAEQSASLATEI